MGRLLILAGACGLWACGGADCVEVDASCTPQYSPTFDAVWSNTLAPSCALSSCHGEGASAGGLSLGADADAGYAALIDGGWVVPADPGCSPLIGVLHQAQMPPGAPLSEPEQCAVQAWVAQGAQR